ncbi:MAG: hypothetical protein AAF492_07085, partial [Verrucomicrobiota bacterium]
ELETQAKEVILDDDEDDELKAALLNSLNYLYQADEVEADVDFYGQLDKVQQASPSENLKQVYRESGETLRKRYDR